MNKKQIKRLAYLDNKVNPTIEDTTERNELQFLSNKQNVNIRLAGKNKYYNAYQCQQFIKHIKDNGFKGYKKDDIENVYITSSPYYGASIKARLISGGETDIKSFNENKELLGFIIGYNEASLIYKAYSETINQTIF